MGVTFSIIVPIYNVEDYLKQCIDSVLGQSYANFELILVDDGSKDNSSIICDKYAMHDSRIQIIHKTNGGLVSARKAGAECAKGEYVICLDGDDFLHPDCLKILHRTILSTKVEIIYFGAYHAYTDHTLQVPISKKLERKYYSKTDIEKKIFPSLIQNADATYMAPQLWGKCFLRTSYVIEQLAVNDSIKLGEDGACTIPIIYNANSLQIIEESLYYYRINPTSITKSGKAFSWDGPELIHRHIESRVSVKEFDFQEQLYRKTTHELFSVIRSQFNRKDNYFTIRKDIIENCKKTIYDECIRKCKFSHSLKAKIMTYALKYRMIELIYLMVKFH